MKGKRFVAILAGGAGERFWPLSRQAFPKQLLQLTGTSQTMLEATCERLQALASQEDTFILTTSQLHGITSDHAPQLPSSNILAEPMKRNTAGAICWATANILARLSIANLGPDDCAIAFVPADHAISDKEGFATTCLQAFEIAESTDALVTIGIVPSRPDPGYGYIEVDPATHSEVGQTVLRFHEKPSISVAETYLKSKNFFWNSGMFFWKLSAFLSALKLTSPEHFKAIHDLIEPLSEGDILKAESIFANLSDISIDYALLEKANSVAMVPSQFDWDDMGSWEAMGRFLTTDERGNGSIGDNFLWESDACLVVNRSENITTCLTDVKDLLVVVTDDAVLIANRAVPGSMRSLINLLKEAESPKL